MIFSLFFFFNSIRIGIMIPSIYQKNHEKGQGIVEYALLIVFSALIIIVSMKLLAPIIGDRFSRIAKIST